MLSSIGRTRNEYLLVTFTWVVLSLGQSYSLVNSSHITTQGPGAYYTYPLLLLCQRIETLLMATDLTRQLCENLNLGTLSVKKKKALLQSSLTSVAISNLTRSRCALILSEFERAVV